MKYKITDEQLQEAVKNSYSFANVLRLLGMRQTGGSQCHIKRRVITADIDYSHFTGAVWNKGQRARNRQTASEYLVKRSSDERRQHAHLLRRSLIELGREHKCEICGNAGEWLGKKLTLQIDHINADWTDDRAENLRFLCPNCHHQTSSFGKRNSIRGATVTQQA